AVERLIRRHAYVRANSLRPAAGRFLAGAAPASATLARPVPLPSLRGEPPCRPSAGGTGPLPDVWGVSPRSRRLPCPAERREPFGNPGPLPAVTNGRVTSRPTPAGAEAGGRPAASGSRATARIGKELVTTLVMSPPRGYNVRVRFVRFNSLIFHKLQRQSNVNTAWRCGTKSRLRAWFPFRECRFKSCLQH